jgi:hypothetical protein
MYFKMVFFMSHQVFPEPDSQWRNIKKGTIYKVWMVATDVDSSPAIAICDSSNNYASKD